MHFVALSVIIQIACAVHCVRNRGNRMWLMVIICLSIPGCLAYFAFEVLPGLLGRRDVRRVAETVGRKLDPERDIRRAREMLETADTAAHRIMMADALADCSRWAEAIRHYDAAGAKVPTPDRATQFKLAAACLEAGRYERARKLLDALPPSSSPSENDRAALLDARLLEQEGDSEQALARYADIGTRMPGAEAQCRQAALLLSLGRRGAALPVLGEVEKRARRLDTFERANHAEMYDWAARILAELRSNQVGA